MHQNHAATTVVSPDCYLSSYGVHQTKTIRVSSGCCAQPPTQRLQSFYSALPRTGGILALLLAGDCGPRLPGAYFRNFHVFREKDPKKRSTSFGHITVDPIRVTLLHDAQQVTLRLYLPTVLHNYSSTW